MNNLNLLSDDSNIYFQNNPQYFIELKSLIKNNPKHYVRMLKSTNKHLIDWINSQLSLLDDSYHISTKCYWILNGLMNFPKCRKCGKPITKKKIKIFQGYHIFCSIKCAMHSNIVQEKFKQTCLEKYGNSNPFKLKKIKDKIKQTCLEKYGSEHPQQSKEVREKIKQTCLEKYRVNCVLKNNKIKNKIKTTMLEKYGVDNPSKSKDLNKKRKNTFLKKYKVDNPWKSIEIKDKIKQTCLEKYGVDSPLKSKEIKEKVKHTCLEKYGVDNPLKLKEFKNKRRQTCLERYGVDNPIKNNCIRLKAQKRYSYNDIHFDSKPEIAYYIWLKDHKISFEYQPNISLRYTFSDKQHVYMPDFKVEDQLIELKGKQFINEDGSWINPFDRSQDDLYEAKHQCCLKNNVKILYQKDYQQYLDYISEKYGKDYLKQFKRN